MVKNTRIVLVKRPTGFIEDDTFKKETVELNTDLKPNEVLVKVEHISLDPAMRGWLRDTRSYIPPVKIGEVMRAGGLGTVEAVGSAVKSFKKGDKVEGTPGWQEYAVLPENTLTKRLVPPGANFTDYLGILGMPGQTAYWGILDVGKPKKGETVVVSGAGGAVGSTVCQIAKLMGCNVVGIAGGADKCQWLEQELGIKAIDYKAKDFLQQFKKIGYFDIYFDNVGGDILNFALTRLNPHARIVMCGAISQYNATKPKGLDTYLNIISQRVVMQGFIVFDYKKRYAEAEKQIGQWLQDGSLKRKETVKYGIDSCIDALSGLFKGENTGKMIVTLEKPSKAHL